MKLPNELFGALALGLVLFAASASIVVQAQTPDGDRTAPAAGTSPATKPPTKTSPTIVPPCDDGTLGPKIADAEAELRRRNDLVDRAQETLEKDRHQKAVAEDAFGIDSEQFRKLLRKYQTDLATWKDLQTRRDEVAARLAALRSVKACPAGETVSPPPTTPPSSVPPCANDQTARDLEASISALGETLADLELAENALRKDRSLSEHAMYLERNPSDSFLKALRDRVKADQDKVDELRERRDGLDLHIRDLKKLGACPVPGNAPPSPTPPAGVPPCGNDEAARDLEGSISALGETLADLELAENALKKDKLRADTAIFLIPRPSDSSLKALRDKVNADQDKVDELRERRDGLDLHIRDLKKLQACPVPGTPPPPPPDTPPAKPDHHRGDTSSPLGGILGHVTIGIGVGGGHRDGREDDDRSGDRGRSGGATFGIGGHHDDKKPDDKPDDNPGDR